ncbi:MAG: DUF3857 domain-containing protein [Candidatus Sulfotelmatobacter sp.]
MKDNPASPGAAAMILYRENFVNEIYVDTDGPYVDDYARIKIFTEKGERWGDVEIEFNKNYSDVKDLKARTIRPDGSIVNFEGQPFEKTIVRASGYKFLAKTFTLPEVKPGCIIEYRYRLQYKPRYLYNEEWIVSEELFTREAHFSILPYVPSSYGTHYPLFFRLFLLPSSDAPKQQPDGSYTMAVRDIPGVEDEPLMPPRQEVEARVEFFHRDSDAPQNEGADQFWARMDKKWNDDLEHFINKKSALQSDLARTIAPNDAPEVKLQKIYARVQKIRDLSYEEGRSKTEMRQENLKEESNVEDVLKNGYANGRQINYLFIALARVAGFEATSVYVAPRNFNAFYPTIQDPREISDDIVWVRVGNKTYFLDPAAIFCPFPMLPWVETATSGLVVNKQGGKFLQTPPPKPSDAATVRVADLQIDEDGNANGKVTVDYAGYPAIGYREEYRKEDEAGRKKKFEEILQDGLPGGNVEITRIDDWGDTSKPIHIEATLKADGFGTPTGRRLLVPSTLFQEAVVRNFESQKRSNDVYFHYPFEISDSITIHVPPGFVVESLPPAQTQNPGAMSYEFKPTLQGNTVVIQRHLVNSVMLFEVKYYSALRAFFNSVKSNDNLQVVFQHTSAKGD